jgi:nucleotide-binding universal stress UspA family protein
MKTLLVPVDFTAASENAVNFAAAWSKKYRYERIILLRSFYTSMYENIIMAGEFANVDEHYLNRTRETEKEQLSGICNRLIQMTGEKIQVHSAISELPLIRSILEIIKREEPVMILLGSDKTFQSGETLISANVISIAKVSPVRVLIVPTGYLYQPIHNVIVPFHFNTIHALDKINRLRASPQWHNVKLLALNVGTKKRNLNPDENFKEGESSLHNYLKNFHHEIYYEAGEDVISGILNFKMIKEAQLLIALPGVHSFLYSLTHKSVSEALYKKCTLPVMILK